ncbi:hypothetical protein OF83DRAFT_1067878, partial [Amylostereum chailletii]
FKKLTTIVGHPSFKPEDISTTDFDAINRVLGDADEDEEWEPTSDEDAHHPGSDWTTTPVHISIPVKLPPAMAKRKRKHPGTAPEDVTSTEYYVGDLHHRPLVPMIRDKLMDPYSSPHFHYDPYEHLWQPTPDGPAQRVYGELYTSDAFFEENAKLQESAPEPGCALDRHIVVLMLGSDESHLTSYGEAAIWPVYNLYGNESKYHRARPVPNLCEHVAFLLKLDGSFRDFLREQAGMDKPSKQFLTHAKRELFHAQLKILIDSDFVEAYIHGIVVECPDGISRRFFPRIFTYTSDYPEKVLVATVRHLGRCPCPRCTIPEGLTHNLGTVADVALRQTLIRCDGYIVNSAAVERLLGASSCMPTENAFSVRLGFTGFDYHKIFAVDIMHDFELGVWKSLFIHLIRLVQYHGAVNTLDERYRHIPVFGKETIRKFSTHISDVHQLAARDYEDILQCAIPVFDGLLPEPDNARLMKLLFMAAHWHGLAKLRLHTEDTVRMLRQLTRQVGRALRDFKKHVCEKYATVELDREREARLCRAVKKALKVAGADNTSAPSAGETSSSITIGARAKGLSLDTYKTHALGYYADSIVYLGTMDSYSTKRLETEHRVSKVFYRRTNKKDFLKQIIRHHRRQRWVQQMENTRGNMNQRVDNTAVDGTSEYTIGRTENNPVSLPVFFRVFEDDVAVQALSQKLHTHLLNRIRAMHIEERRERGEDTEDPCDLEAPSVNDIILKSDRIYRHEVMTVTYTTYDVRRDQDTISPNGPRHNIMSLTPSASTSLPDGLGSADMPTSRFPYRYARVLGIYHANVIYRGPDALDAEPRRIDFLWVRWYEQQAFVGRNAWGGNRLEQLYFPPMSREDAFGVIEPADVLRGCHIIPTYSQGRKSEDQQHVSRHARDGEDWKRYYMNRFVDRDMLMRHHWGKGVGHTYTRVANMHDNSDHGVLQYEADEASDLDEDEINADTDSASSPISLPESEDDDREPVPLDEKLESSDESSDSNSEDGGLGDDLGYGRYVPDEGGDSE